MQIEVIEWDDDNLEHATRHGVSVIEIERAIAMRRSGSATSEAAPAMFGSTRPPTAGAELSSSALMTRRGVYFDHWTLSPRLPTDGWCGSLLACVMAGHRGVG